MLRSQLSIARTDKDGCTLAYSKINFLSPASITVTVPDVTHVWQYRTHPLSLFIYFKVACTEEGSVQSTHQQNCGFPRTDYHNWTKTKHCTVQSINALNDDGVIHPHPSLHQYHVLLQTVQNESALCTRDNMMSPPLYMFELTYVFSSQSQWLYNS